jgi:tetratricopeptide (TPR) repeat protein
MRAMTVAVLSLALAMPAGAADVDTTSEPDLTSVRKLIKAKDYRAALADLTPKAQLAKSADAFSLMGFCLRKTGDQANAFTWYGKALALDPKHKGALEYQGELFAETGQIEKARENAARLKQLCPRGCEELDDLNQAIAAAGKKS